MRRISLRCRLKRDHSSEPAKTDFPGKTKLALGGAQGRLRRKNCASEDQVLEACDKLTGSREPKMDIPG